MRYYHTINEPAIAIIKIDLVWKPEDVKNSPKTKDKTVYKQNNCHMPYFFEFPVKNFFIKGYLAICSINDMT